MAQKSARRPGRPASVVHKPDDRRHIPLDITHAEVQRLDREAERRGMSRAELCRRKLRRAGL